MSDWTAPIRKDMLAEMPDALRKCVEAGEPVWDTESLQRDFTVESFAAPFVIVVRKDDGVKGSLLFNHAPRLYFGWEEA